jgi:ABC-type phosphate transport system substrate-binding protein
MLRFASLVHGLSAVERWARLKHNLNMSFDRTALSRKLRALLLALGALTTTAAAKDVALIANKSNSLPAISMADLVKVCKGQMGHWPDGKPVTIVMRQPGSPELKMVEEKIYGAASQDVRELIATANHSRADRPAIILGNSDEEVIHKVESMPGAIGLVDLYSITGAVQVVKIGGKLPLESGYALHGN